MTSRMSEPVELADSIQLGTKLEKWFGAPIPYPPGKDKNDCKPPPFLGTIYEDILSVPSGDSAETLPFDNANGNYLALPKAIINYSIK